MNLKNFAKKSFNAVAMASGALGGFLGLMLSARAIKGVGGFMPKDVALCAVFVSAASIATFLVGYKGLLFKPDEKKSPDGDSLDSGPKP